MNAHERPQTPSKQAKSSETFGVGGEPSPIVGGIRGLSQVATGVGALVVGAAVIAAVVALLA